MLPPAAGEDPAVAPAAAPASAVDSGDGVAGADGTAGVAAAVPVGAGADRVGSAAGALPVDVPVAAAVADGTAVVDGPAVVDGARVGTAVADADRVAVTAGSRAGGTETTEARAEEVGCAVGWSWPAGGAYRGSSPAATRWASWCARRLASDPAGTSGPAGSATPSSAWDAGTPVARTSTAPMAAA